MFLDLTDDPWAFTGHVVSLSEYADKDTVAVVDGRCDPRIVCQITDVPWYRTPRNKLPSASFPFRKEGKVCSFYYLPAPSKEKHDSDFKVQLGMYDQTYGLIQEDSVMRYTDDMPDDSIEAGVNNWINWSIRLFQELVEAEETNGDDFAGLSRRSWSNIIGQVTNNGEQDAMMSLIVQLSNDVRLKNALSSVTRNPRRILERVRQNLKVSRIQQLDGACIREYARRPGKDTAAKAGPRQELLGLNRIENTDTLENRVCLWVLSTIEKFSAKYVKENSSFINSGRVLGVRKFGRDAVSAMKQPAMEQVSTGCLVHPVQPNYPLQLDRRYQEVYSAYQKLRLDEKEKDDAWEWQRILWACSARLLFYSLFLRQFESRYSNFVYIKNEGVQGRWLSRADAPGPFRIDKKRYYFIDSWDICDPAEWLEGEEIFPGAHLLGNLGCDTILYSQGQRKLLIIWFAYGTNHTEEFCMERTKLCQMALKKYIGDLQRQNKLLSKVNGLIITGSYQKDATVASYTLESSSMPKVSMLVVPHRSYRHTERLQEEINTLIKDFTS